MNNVQSVSALTWTTDVVALCSDVAFADAATNSLLPIPEPSSGSFFANVVGYGFTSWAGPAQSSGNLDVPPAFVGYIAFLAQ
jgi:hypothetical protein